MAITTITPEFAIQEMRRMNAKYWDIYTGDNSGIISCNQNPEVTLEESLELLRTSLGQISGDKVKIKASEHLRSEKGKNPSLRNAMEAWVTIEAMNKQNSTKAFNGANNDLIFQMMQANYEMRLQIELLKLQHEREREKENETIGHPLDNIAGMVLNDPMLKGALIAGLQKWAGVPVSAPPAQQEQVQTPNQAKTKAEEILSASGHNVETIISMVAEFEKNNAGSVANFMQTLQGMGITGKNL